MMKVDNPSQVAPGIQVVRALWASRLPLYPLKAWAGRWTRSVSLWRARLQWALHIRSNQGVCSVEIKSNIGFFGQLTWCLGLLHYCDRQGFIPDIHLTGDAYLDKTKGHNWLEYYFDVFKPLPVDELARRVRYTTDMSRYGPPFLTMMSLHDGAGMVNKYLRRKPYIDKIVDDFWGTLDIDGPVVGVHFRGTDKREEAPRVSWEYCLETLKNYLQEHSDFKAVFVASDEQAFVEFMKSSADQIPVYCHDDHYRSSDGDDQPIHHKAIGEGGYEKGEDALVNALLLSKCSTLIRTTSFLSSWASIFNPKLNVILLNRPYAANWYPEGEILRSRNTKYLPESLV